MVRLQIYVAVILVLATTPAVLAAGSAACRATCAEEYAACKAALLYNCEGLQRDCIAGCPQETTEKEEVPQEGSPQPEENVKDEQGSGNEADKPAAQ